MSNLNKSAYLWIAVPLSCGLWIAFAWLANSHDLGGWASQIPKVVTAMGVLLWMFVKWAWKLPWFRPWLVPFPNLNGTWRGTLKSNFSSSGTRRAIGPIEAELTVTQTFVNMRCTMRTAKMTSTSSSAGFVLDKADDQLRQLVYTYTSRPKLSLSPGNTMHEGTVVLDIPPGTPTTLTGRYWTTRGTMGDLNLSRVR